MVNFSQILTRAETRKGGAKALQALLPEIPDNSAVSKVTDDRILAEMAKCIFRSGFSWKVVEAKWPDFETVFLGFEPRRLAFQPDEYWDEIASDKRIIRHGGKIGAVRHNADFVSQITGEHGSFGAFLEAWPDDDIVGLWDVLAKRGKRLGGNTGRYFLRFIGKDCFLPSADVVSALRGAGLEIAENPTSKRDLKAIQAEFNAWHEETGLPYVHLSRICAMAAGENYDEELLRARVSMADGD
jgi:3-methyladenine DNA glycosylase Tag